MSSMTSLEKTLIFVCNWHTRARKPAVNKRYNNLFLVIALDINEGFFQDFPIESNGVTADFGSSDSRVRELDALTVCILLKLFFWE